MAARTPRSRRARSGRSRLQRSLDAIAGSVAPGVCALVIACAPSDEQGAVSIGASAPPYRAVTVGGDSVSVEALRGKVVLLNIWATWCPPCQQETPDVRAAFEAHRDAGLVVLAIDIQEPVDVVRDYAELYDLEYTIGIDAYAAVMVTYQVFGLPTHYFIDRDGVIRDRYFGPLTRDAMEERIRLISEP